MLYLEPMNEGQVRAIELIAEEYDYGRGSLHAHKVAELAASLFDQIQHLALFPDLVLPDRRTLIAASYAHDLGASPRAYLEATPVLSQSAGPSETPDQGTLSYMVLRSRLDHPSSPLRNTPLSPADRSVLSHSVFWLTASTGFTLETEPLMDERKARLFAGILRIVDALDFRLRLRVRSVKLHKASAWLRILVRTFAPAIEEISRAQQRTDLLGEALGLRVFIQEVIEE